MAENSTSRKDERSMVERKLHRAWRRERNFHHLRGLCFVIVWAVGLLLLDLLVDRMFLWNYRAPGWGRTVLLVMNVVALAVVVWRRWLRHLRRYDPVRLALQMERKHPEFRSLLVSFVQLDSDHAEQIHASPALVEAFRRQALEATRPVDFREIASFRELRRLLSFALVVIVVFAAGSAWQSDVVSRLLQRLVDPTAEVGYPTDTTIESITGSQVVQQGVKLPISAVVDGRIPAGGRMHLRAEGGSWETVPMLNTGEKVFAYEFSDVLQDFEYYVRLGDARSDEFRVKVIPAPKVVSRQIRLDYPAHTGLKSEPQESYYLDVPEGTVVRWTFRMDTPLKNAWLVINRVDKRPMTISEDGLTAEVSAEAWETFEYRFRWERADHPFIYSTPGMYMANVTPDEPPTVEIVYPVEDEKATFGKRLDIVFRAEDHFGLSGAWLEWRVNDGEPKEFRIGPLDGKERTATWRHKLADISGPLKEDDVVTWRVKAADNHGGRRGPSAGYSPSMRVYIVSEAEYLRSITEEYLRWLAEVESLRGEESLAKEEVEGLKKTEPAATQPANP